MTQPLHNVMALQQLSWVASSRRREYFLEATVHLLNTFPQLLFPTLSAYKESGLKTLGGKMELPRFVTLLSYSLVF